MIYTWDHGDNLGTRGLWGKSTMYEESAGVPLIMAGPEVPAGLVSHEPVSLVDCFPTILECAGVPEPPEDHDRPGCPLDTVLRGHAPARTLLSRVPRGRFSHRGLYDPQGSPQIHPLRGDAPAAL